MRLVILFFVVIWLGGSDCSKQNGPQPQPEPSPTPPPTPPPRKPVAVYFIGDSVTAGFGFYNNNLPFENDWKVLDACRPPPVPTDICSNNEPGPWIFLGPQPSGPNAPFVSYSAQFQATLHASENRLQTKLTPVFNYAVSGSTPQDWDRQPLEEKNPGVFSQSASDPTGVTQWGLDLLPKDVLTVLTLGANPLLSRWLYLQLWGVKEFEKGPNVDCTDTIQHVEDCMRDDLADFYVHDHLVNIYKELVEKGDVLVQKYYRLCPSSFGKDAASINVISGPAAGTPCKPLARQMSFRVVDMLNEAIDKAVAEVAQWAKDTGVAYKIAAICPGEDPNACGAFDGHQFNDDFPWLLATDTGIHETALGHSVLARGVFEGACGQLGLFCPEVQAKGPVHWPTDMACPKSATDPKGGCAFVSIYNGTADTLDILQASRDRKTRPAVSWLMAPSEHLQPGQTTRAVIRGKGLTPKDLDGWIYYELLDKTIDPASRINVFFGLDKNGVSTQGTRFGVSLNQSQSPDADILAVEVVKR